LLVFWTLSVTTVRMSRYSSLTMERKCKFGTVLQSHAPIEGTSCYEPFLENSCVLFSSFFSVCGIGLNIAATNDFGSGSKGVAVALTTAFAVIAMAYSFSDISGAHFNPAVTFATWLTRKTSNRKSTLFVIFQLLGAILAMLALMLCFGADEVYNLAITPSDDANLGRVFFMEFMLTFIFVFVIFTTAFENIEQKKSGMHTLKASAYGLTLYTSSPQSKTGFAPLAIGFTAGLLTLIGSTVSGAVFNPARVFAPAMVSGRWTRQWVYWVGDLLGAGCACALQHLFSVWSSAVKTPPDDGGSISSQQPLQAAKNSKAEAKINEP